MLQSMYNYAVDGHLPGTSAAVDTSINAATYRGLPNGVNLLVSALGSAATSSSCSHLETPDAEYDQFWSSSKNIANYNQWRSAGSGAAGSVQVAGTDFWYDPRAFYSPTRSTSYPFPRPRKKPL